MRELAIALRVALVLIAINAQGVCVTAIAE